METLPYELILEIFNHILLITDKRQFLRTCNYYNLLTKQLFLEYEKNYKIGDFAKISKYNVEKYTLELCYNGYFDMIPEHYIIPNNESLVVIFTYFGSIKLLKKLKLKGSYLDCICEYSAFFGQLEVLHWAHKNGCCWNDYHTCANAAENGHLSCLEYAHENGCLWDEYTCSKASFNGHLSCLQYAHENGCLWDENTCAYAASNGHLLCLQYARLNGCDWDNHVYKNAKKYGHIELLNWAIGNGCPI